MAQVLGDELAITLDNGQQEIRLVFEGAITTSLALSPAGEAYVSFRCAPRTVEQPNKHLNEPPSGF